VRVRVGRAHERVDLVLGTLSAGQGHETSFAQLLVEWLGVGVEDGRDRDGEGRGSDRREGDAHRRLAPGSG